MKLIFHWQPACVAVLQEGLGGQARVRIALCEVLPRARVVFDVELL